MEEKNMSAQLEDDELLIEEELDEEEIDEELDEDPDEEDSDDEAEYDFNDEEDDEDPDEDGEEEGEEPAEDTDPVKEEPDKTDEVPTEEQAEPAAEQTEPTEKEKGMRETMAKLLDRLGYHGTYEEAMAAYEADEAKRAEEKSAEEKPAEKTPAKATTVDYAKMASNSLRDINAAFGTSYTDFSQFDDLHRFAELMVGGATALEAYRATQKRFRTPTTEPVADSDPVGKPSKDHLKILPKAGAGETGTSHSDRQALAALRELYPERSVKDLKKTLERVKRARA